MNNAPSVQIRSKSKQEPDHYIEVLRKNKQDVIHCYGTSQTERYLNPTENRRNQSLEIKQSAVKMS